MMYKLNNYIQIAKDHEMEFRAILNYLKISNENMTIEEIYNKYSTGNRYGIWTILDFKKVKTNVYEFTSEDVVTLSGQGESTQFTIIKGQIKNSKNISFWMS